MTPQYNQPVVDSQSINGDRSSCPRISSESSNLCHAEFQPARRSRSSEAAFGSHDEFHTPSRPVTKRSKSAHLPSNQTSDMLSSIVTPSHSSTSNRCSSNFRQNHVAIPFNSLFSGEGGSYVPPHRITPGMSMFSNYSLGGNPLTEPEKYIDIEPFSFQEALSAISPLHMPDMTCPNTYLDNNLSLFDLMDGPPSVSRSSSFKENMMSQNERHPASSNQSSVSQCSTSTPKIVPDYFQNVGAPVPVTPPAKKAGATNSCKKDEKRFKAFHEEKWNEYLEQVKAFKVNHGHCLVPHTYPENQHLARWVKRQRRQYKLMKEGDPTSTMTKERFEILHREGFIWDSHDVIWRERHAQLLEYKKNFGHCRVPSYSKKYPQLASWVKCQRRQFKLFWEGKRSSMSTERTKLLDDIGFTWEVRPEQGQKKKNDYKKLAQVLNEL